MQVKIGMEGNLDSKSYTSCYACSREAAPFLSELMRPNFT